MRNGMILFVAFATAATFERLSFETAGLAFAQTASDKLKGTRPVVRGRGRTRIAAPAPSATDAAAKANTSKEVAVRPGSAEAASGASGLEQAFDATVETFSHRDAKVRAAAIESLGRLQVKLDEQAKRIGLLILDEDPQVRITTLDAVRRMGRVDESSELFSYVVAALFDSDTRVRFRAAVVLRAVKDLALTGEEDLQANKPLPIEIAKGEDLTRRDSEGKAHVRDAVVLAGWYAWAMSRTNDAADRGLVYWTAGLKSDDVEHAIPIVLKCLATADMELLDAAQEHLRDRELRQPLMHGLSSDDPLIRRGAARVLCAIVDELKRDAVWHEHLAALQLGLKDSDSEVRLFCLLALARNGSSVTDKQVIALASDSAPRVRCAAIDVLSLESIDDSAVVLRRLAESDPDLRVRVRATFGLAILMLNNRSAEVDEARAGDATATPSHAAFKPLLAMARACFAARQPSGELVTVRVEGAEQATETIIRAIEAERREPQPVWPRLRGIADDEEFEVLLIETLGVLEPAARGAAAWLVNDLDRFDPLDLAGIRSPSRARMLEAILVALRGIGPVPETINALRSPRRLTRTIAAMALSENADLAPRIAPILVDSLGDEWQLLGLCFNDVFRKDVGCLKKMGHRAVPALLSAIRENRNLELAASSLAGMKSDSERVVPLLAAVVNSKQERTEVRAAVARALGVVGVDDAATARLLTKVLRDSGEHETLRVAAVNGLGLSRVPGTEAVLHEFERDESKAVRVAVEKEFQFRRKQE